MKQVICLFFLGVVFAGITYLTVYTLNNKGIREEVENKVNKTIEIVSSNSTDTSLTNVYNIYLNKDKHKIKVEYSMFTIDEVSNISLNIYFDGKNILDNIVIIGKYDTLDQVWEDENLNISVFNENNFKILNISEDYLLITISYNKEYLLEKYFMFDSEGNILTSDEGILLYDSSKTYISDDKTFDFYNGDRQVLARINKNVIYSLEEKVEKKKIILEEYKYFINDNKLEKELVNTYSGIKVQNNIVEEDE